MDYHYHARMTWRGREVLSRQSAAKWVCPYRERGVEGLEDGSLLPRRLRQPTSPELVAGVEALRCQRWTGVQIAQRTGLGQATVSRNLVRLKLLYSDKPVL
jgi:hypothetical protein